MRLLWTDSDSSSLGLSDGRVLDLREKTVMGVINRTPDSFYPSSRFADVKTACQQAVAMVSHGAKIIDVGGESTRPGSNPVDADDECGRVLPVIESLRAVSNVAISIDTQKAGVAERALDAGADLLNDVSALREPDMQSLAADRRVPVVLVHMLGTPKTMQHKPRYDDVVAEVFDDLRRFMDRAMAAGVSESQMIIDPGIGFGKRVEDNLAILREIEVFCRIGRPVLIGVSQKSFLGKILGDRPVHERCNASIACNCLALAAGADIIRVHDVEAAVDTVSVLKAVKTGMVL